MQAAGSARERSGQEGFTLIELMVVVLILGILIAIALPTFLGARTRAQDSGAKAILKNAATGAAAFFADNQTFDAFDTPGVPEAEELGIRWRYGGVAVVGEVTINLADDGLLVMSSRSEPSTYFCVKLDYGGGSAPLIRGGVDANGATMASPLCVVPTW